MGFAVGGAALCLPASHRPLVSQACWVGRLLREMPALSQQNRWRVSELVPATIWAGGLRRGWANVAACPFSSRESLNPQTIDPCLPTPSTLPPASNYFKLLLLCWVSGVNERAHSSFRSDRSLRTSQCFNSLWCLAPLVIKAQCNVESYSWSRSPQPVVLDA